MANYIISKSKHKIPIYHGTLYVIYTKDLKPIIKKHNLREGSEKCDAFVFSVEGKKGGIRYYAVFEKNDVSVLAHEALHIVNFIFDDKHITPDVKNDEPQAYLIGWVFDKIYKTVMGDDA